MISGKSGAKSLTRQAAGDESGGFHSKAFIPRLDLRRITEPDSNDLNVAK